MTPRRGVGRPVAWPAALAAGLLAAGCSLAPRYERPASPVVATYPPELAPAGPDGSAAAADVEWRQFFADPRLRRLIELSLQNNRDLRVAILNIEQARATYAIRRADQVPNLGVGLNASRQPGAYGGTSTFYTSGLQLASFELDFFGRVRNLSESALAQYLATAEARKSTQITLIGSVATTYIAILADDELLRVTRDALATRENSHRLTQLRFDNGASSEIDLRQSEQLLETAKATLAQTQRQKSLDENALTLLVGQPLSPDLPAPLPLAEQPGRADLPAGLPSDLLARRPDIRSAEQQLIGANANIGVARAAFFPRISLTGSAGSASTQLSGLFKAGTWAVAGTGNLFEPLFEGGRNRATLEMAKVQREVAVAQYERSIQIAFREVADALAGRATFGEQLRAQAAVTNAAQVAYDLANLRYKNGASSYFDVLDAQRTLFSSQQSTVQVQAARAQNFVTLYRVLGGGWTEPPDAPVLP